MVKKIFLTLLLLQGCAAGPATSPSPPAEIPSLLVVPDTVKINTNEIAASASISQPPLFSVNTNGTYGQTIADARAVAVATDAISDAALNIFNNVEIPTSISVTYCELSSSGATCNGSPIEGTKINTIKIDFADFDIDGVSGDEGCSGTSCPVICAEAGCTSCPSSVASNFLRPVCMRIWSNGTPILAMRLDELPIPDLDDSGNVQTDSNGNKIFTNKGSGTFRFKTSTTSGSTQTATKLKVAYDHKDSADSRHEFTDLHLVEEDAATSNPNAIVTTRNLVSRVDQETISFSDATSSVRKQLKLGKKTIDASGTTPNLTHFNRFFENGRFFRGTNNTPADTTDQEFTNLCIDLNTGEEPVASSGLSQETINLQCERLNVSDITVFIPPTVKAAFTTDMPDDFCQSDNLKNSTNCKK